MNSSSSDQSKYGSSMSASTQQTSAKPPYPWNLTRFYNMSDAPWVPKDLIPNASINNQTFSHISPNVNFPTAGSSFNQYRNSRPVPSECDTNNDDSGYGSTRPPYSTTENNSVYEDDPNPDAQTATHLLGTFRLDTDTISNSQVSTSWAQPQSASSQGKHWCHHCKQWLKTKSELNKHNFRHNKPFRCDVRDCSRKDGFGTKNDLDRHKKSVHSDRSVSGTLYICRLDSCGARGESKLWPRADNFRSHLRRIHHKNYSAEDNLDDYIYRESRALSDDSHATIGPISHDQPALGEDLQGVGGTALSYINTNTPPGMQKSVGTSFPRSFLDDQAIVANSRPDILADDLDSILEASISFEEKDPPSLPNQEPDSMLMQSDILKGAGQGSLQNGRSFSDQMISLPSARLSYPNETKEGLAGEGEISLAGHEDELRSLGDATESLEHGGENPESYKTTPSEPKRPEPTEQTSEQTDAKASGSEYGESSSKASIPSRTEVSTLISNNSKTLLDFLKMVPKELLKSALNGEADDSKSSSSSQDSASQKNPHKCPGCAKTFNRQCELKKHLKRHEKPYGCTFEKCPKSFGSKNDWKRHESSQHWQLEIWKCEETKSSQKEPCGRICHRRESFRNHLQKEHSLTDPKQVDDRIDRCRIGRHCDPRFWCGFCKEIIQIKGEGVNAWTKRCDHIDNHFCGRDGLAKKNISEWKYIESEEEKGDKSHSDPNTQAPTKQIGSNPESLTMPKTPLVTKRKSSTDADAPSHKRQKRKDSAGTHDMWYCCCCRADMLINTSWSCYSCEHPRCENCTVTRVHHREEERR